MSNASPPRDDMVTRQLAEPSLDDDRGAARRCVRCRVAAGPTPRFTDAMCHLLRTRLRLAILIILVGFAFHFLKVLLLSGSVFDHRTPWLIFSGCEIAVMVIASALLWSSRPLSLKSLRLIELTVFGMIAALFAWLQVDTYHDGALLRALVPGQETIVFKLVGVSAALRWFLLIVLYGVFIPNTWRRCATIVGSLAVLPIALMVAGSQLDRNRSADATAFSG